MPKGGGSGLCWKMFRIDLFSVGAVYDRAYFVDSKKNALTDRAYNASILVFLTC
jgi:hypothetical protein